MRLCKSRTWSAACVHLTWDKHLDGSRVLLTRISTKTGARNVSTSHRMWGSGTTLVSGGGRMRDNSQYSASISTSQGRPGIQRPHRESGRGNPTPASIMGFQRTVNISMMIALNDPLAHGRPRHHSLRSSSYAVCSQLEPSDSDLSRVDIDCLHGA
jgi:hypothetical protein